MTSLQGISGVQRQKAFFDVEDVCGSVPVSVALGYNNLMILLVMTQHAL